MHVKRMRSWDDARRDRNEAALADHEKIALKRRSLPRCCVLDAGT